MTTPRFWADLTTCDFANLDPATTVAVLPVAATEQHGPHLPLRVDQALVDAVVAAALPHLPPALGPLFLPTQQVGYSPEHTAFPGTLTLSAATVIANWVELGQCVAASGVQKLLLLNSHGGQVGLMDIAARELRTRRNLIVYSCSWWNLPLGDSVTGLFSADEHRFGVHAGEIETSMMLALAPELVDMNKASNFRSTSQERAARYPLLGNGTTAKLGWAMQDYNPDGAAGNALAATAIKGQAVLEAAGFQLARLLQEIASLPLGTIVKKEQP